MENYIDTLEHCDSDELKHYGILGMKWGRRRYQNKDGSLTDAGRKRYDNDPTNDDVGDSKSSSSATPAKKKAPSEMTGKDYKQMKPDDMTDEELVRAINRSRNEAEYRRLNPEPVSKGKQFMEKLLNEAIIPGAVNAGKNFLDKNLTKLIDQAVKDSTPVDELAALTKKKNILSTKKDIAQLEDDLKNVGKKKEKSNAEKIKEHKEQMEAELWENESYREAYRMGMYGDQMKKAKEGNMKDAVDDFNSRNFKGSKNDTDSNSDSGSNKETKSESKQETKSESKSESKQETKSESKSESKPKDDDIEVVTGTVEGKGKSFSTIKAKSEAGKKWFNKYDVKEDVWDTSSYNDYVNSGRSTASYLLELLD